MKKALLVITFVLSLFLVSCGEQATPPQNSTTSTNQTTQTNNTDSTMNTTTKIDQTAMPVKGEQIATMTTNYGVIKIKFFPSEAPKTVQNFIELSKKDFYKGLIFHRVIKDFMIQGGDPKGTGQGGQTWDGNKLFDEISTKLSHINGAVAMANAGPNTASSQFYIVQNEKGVHQLDGGYTIFGQVYEGQDVVDAISSVETDICGPNEVRAGCDKPKKDVKIEKVEIAQF